jgi:ketosteroid isomerase-like protein
VDEKPNLKNSMVSQASPTENRDRNPELDELFEQLKQETPRPGQPLAAAARAIQDLEVEFDAEKVVQGRPRSDANSRICASCGNRNRESNKFCAMCGAPLGSAEKTPGYQQQLPDQSPRSYESGPEANGQHHYHHHYHHHFFSSSPEMSTPEMAMSPRMASGERPARELVPARAPLSGPAMSRAEGAIRRLTQDLALACNTKQLNDVVELYAADSLLMRPNTPPIRGSAAIREFFFSALDSGLGEMEMETLRVEVLGDVAYDAGRYKVLVPSASGKRREERGKYLIMYHRRGTGEWKILADCWSSDLTLNPAAEAEAARTNAPITRPGPRKSA